MSYIDLNKPIDASFELNNICNLMCPQCARNTVKDGILKKIQILVETPYLHSIVTKCL